MLDLRPDPLPVPSSRMHEGPRARAPFVGDLVCGPDPRTADRAALSSALLRSLNNSAPLKLRCTDADVKMGPASRTVTAKVVGVVLFRFEGVGRHGTHGTVVE